MGRENLIKVFGENFVKTIENKINKENYNLNWLEQQGEQRCWEQLIEFIQDTKEWIDTLKSLNVNQLALEELIDDCLN